ncbi:MAG: hypothetical protein IKB95_03090 [Bacteroidales bacterium]|nr:hypothetical protein [Bacteroidales bacterium]
MKNVKQSPPVLAAQKERKEYHRPTFEVIDLNIQSPLLAGSGTPSPKINPIKPSNESW